MKSALISIVVLAILIVGFRWAGAPWWAAVAISVVWLDLQHIKRRVME